MLNVLIVDDEKIAREGLRDFTDWAGLNCRVLAAVPSFEAAVEKLDEEDIDIVITDIVMKGKNGLDLTEYIQNNVPDTKVVILSGYGEFEYAQKAMRLGAFDFLTKPVSFEDLAKVIGRIESTIEEERRNSGYLKTYLYLMREKFLNNLVEGVYSSDEEIQLKQQEADITLEARDGFVILRFYFSECNWADISKQQLIDIMREHAATYLPMFLFENSIKEIAALLPSAPGIEQIHEKIEGLIDVLEQEAGCVVHVGTSRMHYSLLEANTAYNEAGKALEYRIMRKTSGIFDFDEVSRFFKGETFISDVDREGINNAFNTLEVHDMRKAIGSIFDELAERRELNIGSVYECCIDIYLTIEKNVAGFSDSIKDRDDYTLIAGMLKMDNIKNLRTYMTDYACSCVEKIKDARSKNTVRIVEDAKSYIREHFNEDITLNRLADMLYINNIYLSKLFKEKTGENFIDYLTRVRIDQAKLLLKDPSLKIYTISELIGYDSPKYFSKVFKDIVGMTPREYKASLF